MPLRTMLAASLVLPILGPTAFAQEVTRPAGYEIVRVTDNQYREFWPRINNRGQIVFTRWVDQSNRSTQEIYLYDSRTDELTRLTNDDIQDIHPDINDDGVICWRRSIGYNGANMSPGEIVTYRDGQITRLTDHPDNDSMPRINRSGHVVWARYYLQAGLGADVFFYDGQSIRQITDDGASDNVTNHQAKVNDIGQIIWGRYRFDQTPWTSRVMLYEDGQISELTTGQRTPMSPEINNRSVATWTHRLVPGETAIDVWENGQTTLFTDWGCCGTLNERSQIAFNRFHNDTRIWAKRPFKTSCRSVSRTRSSSPSSTGATSITFKSPRPKPSAWKKGAADITIHPMVGPCAT